MSKPCPACGGPTKPLLTSWYCAADCDLPREQRTSASKPAQTDWLELWQRAGLTPPAHMFTIGAHVPPTHQPPAPTQSVAPPTVAFDVGTECWVAASWGKPVGRTFWAYGPSRAQTTLMCRPTRDEAVDDSNAMMPGAHEVYRVRVLLTSQHDDTRFVEVIPTY